jgi:hypothetical protein
MGRGGVRVVLERYVSRTVFCQFLPRFCQFLQRRLKPTQRARSGVTRPTTTGVRPASRPIARRRKPTAKTNSAAKVADAEEGVAPDIIMKEPDIPDILDRTR